MRETMNLSDLRTGDIVLSTKGSYGIVLRGAPSGDIIKWYRNAKGNTIDKFRSFYMINNDLSFKYDSGNNRIIKVWRSNDKHYIGDRGYSDGWFKYQCFELIYEDKIKEVTMDEVEAKFGCKVKIKND